MSSPYDQPAWQPQPGGYAPVRRTNGMAVASLATSLGSLFFTAGLLGIVGAILGHVARGQIRRTGEDGAGLALAGILVGWISFALVVVGVLLFVLFVVVLASSSTSP